MAIEYRWAENQFDRLPELAAELVRRQVAVIAATDTAVGAGGQGSNHDYPHRLRRRGRPGRAWSCRQPRPAGRQSDRYQLFSQELVAKRLELLRELVPGATRVAVLVNPAVPHYRNHGERRGAGCSRHRAANPGLQRQHQPRDQCGLCNFCARTAGRAFCRQRRLLSQSGVSNWSIWRRATRSPRHIGAREFAEAGGLMSYGATSRMLIARSAPMPAAFSRAPSQPTCRWCRRPSSNWSSTPRPPGCSALTVPPTLLARADEVIE